METNQLVRELLEAPLLIAAIKDKEVLNTLDNLIPYSTGFEIEAHYKKGMFNVTNFTSIPYIVDVNCDSYEQRFRIPNGIRGIICLYLISRQLRINCELNMDSGIHYHVDCTDVNWSDIMNMASKNRDYILRELDSWGYKRVYSSRTVSASSSWLRFNTLNTFEFRIGEMTYDYSMLLKRIIHINAITRYVKKQLEYHPEPIYKPCDFGTISKYLKLPYSLAAYSTSGLTSRLADIRKKIEAIDKKPEEQQIQIRNRRHVL